MMVAPIRHMLGVRFGWSAKEPPEYRMSMTPDDIEAIHDGSLRPKDEFIRKACEKLDGPDDSTPRFLVIPDLSVVAKTEKQLRTLQKNLVEAISAMLEARRPNSLNPVKDLNVPVKRFVKAFQMPHSLSTASVLHFDQLSSPLVSLLYGPNVNIFKSSPRIADLRQFVRDKGLSDEAIPDFLNGTALTRQDETQKNLRNHDMEMVRMSLNEREGTVNKASRDAVERAYTLTLDELDFEHQRPLVIINNTLAGGIVHAGPNTVILKDPDDPQAKRPIWYTALRVLPEKADSQPSQNLPVPLTVQCFTKS